MGNIFAELALAEVLGTAGIFDYFVDSNMAGKGVIFVLALLNCWALSIMFSKRADLKKSAWPMPGMKKELMNFPR